MTEPSSFKRYGVPLEIHLTDSLRTVVSRRRKRFMLWHMLIMPYRLARGICAWVLDGERQGKTQRLPRRPDMLF